MIDYAEQIKEAVTCQQFAEYIGLKVDRNGFTRCPFHGEKTASLKIYKGGRGWCCFGCHKGGDVINFAMLWYKIGFKEALKRLDTDFSLGLYNSVLSDSKHVLSAVQIARRKALREREKRSKEALEAEYWAVFDKWLAGERIIQRYEPKSMNEDFPDDFVQALKDRLGLRERLKDLEIRRNNFYEPVGCPSSTGVADVQTSTC